VAGSCEHYNAPLSCRNGGAYLDRLRYHNRLEKDAAVWTDVTSIQFRCSKFVRHPVPLSCSVGNEGN
jgi:hypothetical protein